MIWRVDPDIGYGHRYSPAPRSMQGIPTVGVGRIVIRGLARLAYSVLLLCLRCSGVKGSMIPVLR